MFNILNAATEIHFQKLLSVKILIFFQPQSRQGKRVHFLINWNTIHRRQWRRFKLNRLKLNYTDTRRVMTACVFWLGSSMSCVLCNSIFCTTSTDFSSHHHLMLRPEIVSQCSIVCQHQLLGILKTTTFLNAEEHWAINEEWSYQMPCGRYLTSFFFYITVYLMSVCWLAFGSHNYLFDIVLTTDENSMDICQLSHLFQVCQYLPVTRLDCFLFNFSSDTPYWHTLDFHWDSSFKALWKTERCEEGEWVSSYLYFYKTAMAHIWVPSESFETPQTPSSTVHQLLWDWFKTSSKLNAPMGSRWVSLRLSPHLIKTCFG